MCLYIPVMMVLKKVGTRYKICLVFLPCSKYWCQHSKRCDPSWHYLSPCRTVERLNKLNEATCMWVNIAESFAWIIVKCALTVWPSEQPPLGKTSWSFEYCQGIQHKINQLPFIQRKKRWSYGMASIQKMGSLSGQLFRRLLGTCNSSWGRTCDSSWLDCLPSGHYGHFGPCSGRHYWGAWILSCYHDHNYQGGYFVVLITSFSLQHF